MQANMHKSSDLIEWFKASGKKKKKKQRTKSLFAGVQFFTGKKTKENKITSSKKQSKAKLCKDLHFHVTQKKKK